MATATHSGHPNAVPAVPLPRLTTPTRRRQPAYIAVGVALVVIGGLGSVKLTTTVGHRSEVLAVARPVRVGAVITDDDLAVLRIGRDPRLATVAATDRRAIVGQVAAVPLMPGALISRDVLTAALVPAAGQQLVGVALKAGQFPASELTAGDTVSVIATPGDQSAQAVPADPVTATVHAVGRADPNGVVVVDLVVATADGATVAQEASTGRVALVLQSKGR